MLIQLTDDADTKTKCWHVLPSRAMKGCMARGAQRDQVFLRIGSRMAPELPVVHLEIRHRATGLAPPVVATQDLLSQRPIRRGIQPQPGRVGPHRAHDVFSPRPPRNACCCSPGKNLKNLVIEYSNISGFPPSRWAPARKSAQIISRQ